MRSYRIRLKFHWLAKGLCVAATLSAGSARPQTPPSGIQATTAALALPAQIVFDAAGNLYIADMNNNIVREVNLAGIVTTVAGTGEQGFSGDGGPAVSAMLDSPAGVAVDAAGNIYIADTHNQRIRKVSGGTITTIAGTGIAGFSGDGGPAGSATFSNPTALALDAAANLYIADTDNHRIRKISGTTISTVAGSGEQFFSGDGGAAIAAGLDSPNGVAVDAAGNIFIGDTHNQRVRVVSAAGTISTLAGTDNKTYAGDGGAATAASLARPRGLSVDAQGNIYVADSDNNRIRLIANTGNISTVAGNGSQGLAGDGGPAISAMLDTPQAPALQSSGGFALSDTNNGLIREVGSDGIIHSIAGLSPGTGGGQGLPGETLTLNGPSTIAYGSGSLTAIFTNGNQVATGQVSLVDTDASPTPLSSAPLTNNVASIDASMFSAGTHHLVVSYAGDAQNPPITSSVFVLSITPLPVIADAAGVSLRYRQAIPPIGGTLNGVLPRDSNNVAAVFSTTATAASPVGQYPISVALTGLAASNYTATLAADSGSVQIEKAATTVTLTSSNIAPYIGTLVTLTAQVNSTTAGIPTGTVNFYDGTTLLATAAVSASGSASYISSAFASGAHSITAVYSGDADFTTITSPSVVETVAALPDFTFTANGEMTQSVNPGQTATYNFTLQPQSGAFTTPIMLTASGLPVGATAVFSPAMIAPGSTTASFTLGIKTAPLTVSHVPPSSPISTRIVDFSAALFLLPLVRNKLIRASVPKMPRVLLSAFFALIAGAATLGLTGCGSGGFFPQSPQTYTVAVTATANSGNVTLQHTTKVTLIVQ